MVQAIAPAEHKQTRLVLAESVDGPEIAAPWIGPLLALGTRASRYAKTNDGRQLVIALSVPKRDFAAALIGCGWVLASQVPSLPEPLETLRGLAPGQPIRAVNSNWIIAGNFTSLDEGSDPPRAQFAGSTWRIDGIRALATLDELGNPEREPRWEPTSIEHMAGLDVDWEKRLALPAADLAIVGTLKWLEEDFDAYLGKEHDHWPLTWIRRIVKPRVGRVATWFTSMYSSARVSDHLPFQGGFKAVILDGNGAVKHLAEIDAPVVICVLDRSIADETGAEIITQFRNTRGVPVSLAADVKWQPPAGVEALSFTMAL